MGREKGRRGDGFSDAKREDARTIAEELGRRGCADHASKKLWALFKPSCREQKRRVKKLLMQLPWGSALRLHRREERWCVERCGQTRVRALQLQLQ